MDVALLDARVVVVMRPVLEAKLAVARMETGERIVGGARARAWSSNGATRRAPGQLVVDHVRVPVGMVHRLVMMGRELVPLTLVGLRPRGDRTFGLLRQLLQDRSDTVGVGHVDPPVEFSVCASVTTPPRVAATQRGYEVTVATNG